MSEPTRLYTPAEIELLDAETFEELLYRAIGGEKVVADPPEDWTYYCIRCGVRHELWQHVADETPS